MPVWILIILISTGNPNHYFGDVVDVFGNKDDCAEAMNAQDIPEPLACVEIE